jgi:tetratricopeptide (TPR) repeat protein
MRDWRIPLRAALLVLSAAASGAPAAFAGDAKIAEALFKSGKQSFQKGEFADAASFFRKAAEEDPALVESVWWRASALEKSGDKAGALAAYREFLTQLDAKSSSLAPSKEELRLKGLAEKSVAALAGGEKEFAALEEAYLASLLKFARDNSVRDPGVALRALGQVLAIRPDHAEAAKLRERLGGGEAGPETASKDGPAAAAGPFKDVKKWKDFLALKTFQNPGFEYVDGNIVLDTKTGSMFTPSEFTDLGESFAYETEVRIKQSHEHSWLTGLTFAGRGKAQYSGFIRTSSVVLITVDAAGATQDLGEVAVPPLDAKAWHRIGLVVRGPEVEVWVNGTKRITWKEPSGAALTGDVGVFQQGCCTERRLFRAGRLD